MQMTASIFRNKIACTELSLEICSCLNVCTYLYYSDNFQFFLSQIISPLRNLIVHLHQLEMFQNIEKMKKHRHFIDDRQTLLADVYE